MKAGEVHATVGRDLGRVLYCPVDEHFVSFDLPLGHKEAPAARTLTFEAV